MNILDLNAERIFKVAGDPATYAAAPFLEPMKNSSMAAWTKYRNCPKCQKPAYLRTARLVGAAFARLVSEADPSTYPPLREVILKILNVQAIGSVAHGPSSTKANIRSAALRRVSRCSVSSVASRLANHS